ncbi:putative zinc finger protein 112, partial [Lasius niger]
MKQENIKKELSENSKTLSLSPNNSKVWIQDISSDWFIPLRKADTPKNVANVVVNNSPPPGDEAESNGSSNFESNKLAVPDNIEGSPPIVPILPIEPKEACPLESNTISFQNKENANLSASSIINECKVRRKCSKISELITNEQKQIIETHYLVDTDIINKYAEEVRNNMTVRDKNNIECNLCPAKYSRLDKCEVHIWAHLNIKPYKCKQCSFSTVTLSNVRCHIRKSHLKIKPFACKLCLKQYATFALLKEHVNIHTGVRPYKCETCGFSSTSRQALSNHMGTHMLSE